MTGDGRLLPNYLKAQIGRELDRLELLLEQIKAVEAERDSLLASTEANKRPSQSWGCYAARRCWPRVDWARVPSTYGFTFRCEFSTLSVHFELSFRVLLQHTLNGWPMYSPTDASPSSSRMPTHGSGQMRIATPLLHRTFTTYSLPVSTGAPVCLNYARRLTAFAAHDFPAFNLRR